jgi:transcriptional regulator GlxA family with amidase domain
MKIAITVFEGCYGSSFTGPQDLFQIANYFLPVGHAPFDLALVSPKGGQVKLAGGGEITTLKRPKSAEAFDLIYVPSFPYIDEETFNTSLRDNEDLIAWLGAAGRAGGTITASCTATFLLAASGVLNHKRAATTWWLEKQFRRRYPSVKLDRQAIVIRDAHVMTAGAMTSSLNLAIEIVSNYASPELAAKVARMMMIDTSRQVQPFLQGAILQAETDHPVVLRAQDWLQTHMAEKIDIARLADHLGVSSRSLNRYFRAELGMTTLEYLQSVRIEKSKLLLENTKLPLAQVVAEIGYSDVRSFTSLFQRQVGMKPSAFRASVSAG